VNTRVKCKVEGRVVLPCRALEDSSNGRNPREGERGIWSWVNRDLDDMEMSMVFYGAQSGVFAGKTSIAFNFCPFCGERIDAPFSGNRE